MSHPFTHQSLQTLVNRVAQFFEQGKCYITQRRSLLFVCGGPVGPGDNSARKKFFEFANTNLPSFAIFLAESAAKDIAVHGESRFLNLADFEKFISHTADCIVIFPEQIGAHAETGYFSAKKEIYKKALIINDTQFQTRESFLNNGPIDIFNRYSDFRPTIHLDLNGAAIDFAGVKERLSRIVHKNRKKFEFKKFKEMNGKEKLFLISEIIRLFGVIDIQGIASVIQGGFGAYDIKELRRYISLLISSDYVARTGEDEELLHFTEKHPAFIEYIGVNVDTVKVAILEAYQKYVPQFWDALPRQRP